MNPRETLLDSAEIPRAREPYNTYTSRSLLSLAGHSSERPPSRPEWTASGTSYRTEIFWPENKESSRCTNMKYHRNNIFSKYPSFWNINSCRNIKENCIKSQIDTKFLEISFEDLREIPSKCHQYLFEKRRNWGETHRNPIILRNLR